MLSQHLDSVSNMSKRFQKCKPYAPVLKRSNGKSLWTKVSTGKSHFYCPPCLMTPEGTSAAWSPGEKRGAEAEEDREVLTPTPWVGESDGSIEPQELCVAMPDICVYVYIMIYIYIAHVYLFRSTPFFPNSPLFSKIWWIGCVWKWGIGYTPNGNFHQQNGDRPPGLTVVHNFQTNPNMYSPTAFFQRIPCTNCLAEILKARDR